jgi:TDG/mug DNA glycosylase family protein
MTLAHVHREMAVDSPLVLRVDRGDPEAKRVDRLRDLVVGAGFDVDELQVEGQGIRVRARRARTLPDTVGPGMSLLVCGLNPSLYAADFGVGYARPGNRFWPAARAAGIADHDRDPVDALVRHGMGMTDLVKRATTGSSELTAAEYREGAARVERLARWLRPGAVCFVGLAGWRAAVDRNAAPGEQAAGFGGVPAYVMPSTSGANAHARLDDLADHLRAAAALSR